MAKYSKDDSITNVERNPNNEGMHGYSIGWSYSALTYLRENRFSHYRNDNLFFGDENANSLYSFFAINKIEKVSRVVDFGGNKAFLKIHIYPHCKSQISEGIRLSEIRPISSNRFSYSVRSGFNHVKINENSSYQYHGDISPSLLNEIYIGIGKNNFLDGVNKNGLKDKISFIVEQLVSLNPDSISFELTEEKSIYFTLKLDERTVVFVDHYLELSDKDMELDGDDSEIVISVFRNKLKVFDYDGKISSAIITLTSFLN